MPYKDIEKRRARLRKYRAEHPGYREKGRKTCRLYMAKLLKSNPVYSRFMNAKDRCTNKNNKNYIRYGGRGIQFKLTMEDLKYLWERDSATLLKDPCLDRIDNDGNYEINNCRFIERSENSIKGCK